MIDGQLCKMSGHSLLIRQGQIYEDVYEEVLMLDNDGHTCTLYQAYLHLRAVPREVCTFCAQSCPVQGLLTTLDAQEYGSRHPRLQFYSGYP